MDEKRHGGKEGSNNGGNIKKNNKNIIKKLQDREISSKPHRAFVAATVPHRFQNLRLSHQLDSHDPKHNSSPSLFLPFFTRTKIVEIVATKSIVFVLSQSGLCTVFSTETDNRICFMNVSPDEVITSIFYNKINDSLITVSVYASDEDFTSAKCRSTRIEYITSAKPDAGFHLFQPDSIKKPGFVEFDDVNAKVLVYFAQDSIYKVFDLKNYNLLYSFSDRNVQEIMCSPGIMLIIFNRESDCIPIKIISIEDGLVLKAFYYPLYPNKALEFIEQCNEKLLVKQENQNLQILDLRSFKLRVVGRTEFMSTPAPFTILYGNQVILTLRNRTIFVWNFRGELVTSLEDHLLWHRDFNINNSHITSDEDLIISYCKAYSEDEDKSIAVNMVGSINVSNILSGKSVAKINAANPLEGITALYYDEDRNELYAGNIHGIVHVWSNQLMKKKD